MPLGWSLAALFEAKPADVAKTTVDCGTCPVSLQCIAGNGGNGWRFQCCGSTAVEVDGHLLIMDCQENRFEQKQHISELKICPLCSGDLVKAHLLGMSDHHRYMPTVHTKVPLKERLALWKKTWPAALELKARVDAGSKKP